MAVKIRLKRIGAKKKPFYRIVVADARYPRDGRFIEQIGTYDPMPNPAKVIIDGGKALQWIKNGAQPTDTVRALLKSTGALEKAKEEALKNEKQTAAETSIARDDAEPAADTVAVIPEDVAADETPAEAPAAEEEAEDAAVGAGGEAETGEEAGEALETAEAAIAPDDDEETPEEK